MLHHYSLVIVFAALSERLFFGLSQAIKIEWNHSGESVGLFKSIVLIYTYQILRIYRPVFPQDYYDLKCCMRQRNSGTLIMGQHYYVNKTAQSNGDHEVHVSTCKRLPGVDDRVYMGTFDSCGPAVSYAKKTYPQANGCYHCCDSGHAT